MKRILVFIGLLLLLESASCAELEFNSDRPGVADGAETVGAGRVQIEAGLLLEFRAGSTAARRLLAAGFSVRF